MRIDVLTLFPEVFENLNSFSIIKKAIDSNKVQVRTHNLRDYADNSRKVDDYPYGGFPGMLIKIEPIDKCIEYLKKDTVYDEIIYLTPDGDLLSQKQSNYDLYCPMIDARRMEVFSSFYDKDNNQLRAVMADIIDENSYNKELKNKVLFFGDGSNKCKDVLTSGNAYFTDNFSPSATYMGILSLEKYNNKDFEDVAYFEPFYLKDFVIGKKN